MKNEKLVRALKENENLAKQLIQMWTEKTKTEEIVDVLAKEGIVATAEDVEDLFAEMQNAKAKAIGLQSMDEEQLKSITGAGWTEGGDKNDDCRSMYKISDSCLIAARCCGICEHPVDKCDVNFECESIFQTSATNY